MRGKTLGAFLAEQPKKRGRHHTRGMIEDEFARLWAAQKDHHTVLADPDFEARIHHLVFYQRPTFWRLATLGRCPWVPEAPLAPKTSWIAQRFMVLEQLTKSRIAGANQRPLFEDERGILLDLADRQKSTSWNGVRRALRKLWRDGAEAEDQTFNMEVSKAETGIKGNIVEIELRNIFGQAWEDHPHRGEIRREIHDRLWTADYLKIGNVRVEIRRPEEAAKLRRDAAAAMQRDWGVTEEQADVLAKLELPSGWLRLSTEAIEAMLPEMERGHSVGDLLNSSGFARWREHSFPTRDRPTGEAPDRLPSHPRSMPELRNPTNPAHTQRAQEGHEQPARPLRAPGSDTRRAHARAEGKQEAPLRAAVEQQKAGGQPQGGSRRSRRSRDQ
ncbi:MAG: hypothetical protein JOY83_23820 [Alphaproteobacteria bacterium]|nr:hypothetical protein [Alphaproteobacteria bacterium]